MSVLPLFSSVSFHLFSRIYLFFTSLHNMYLMAILQHSSHLIWAINIGRNLNYFQVVFLPICFRSRDNSKIKQGLWVRISVFEFQTNRLWTVWFENFITSLKLRLLIKNGTNFSLSLIRLLQQLNMTICLNHLTQHLVYNASTLLTMIFKAEGNESQTMMKMTISPPSHAQRLATFHHLRQILVLHSIPGWKIFHINPQISFLVNPQNQISVMQIAFVPIV
jgi:hypothetical protein